MGCHVGVPSPRTFPGVEVSNSHNLQNLKNGAKEGATFEQGMTKSSIPARNETLKLGSLRIGGGPKREHAQETEDPVSG